MVKARDILEGGKTFSSPQRLTIMFLLYLHKKVGFTELRKLLQLTPGNLDHHIRKLEELGYVKTGWVVRNRPLSIIKITQDGEKSFRNYAIKLRDLLDVVANEGHEINLKMEKLDLITKDNANE